MKKRIISFLLCLILCLSLVPTALAVSGENSGVFDPTVTIDRKTAGKISVTVVADNSILSTKKPTLTVPCDFKNADVLFGGNSIDSTIADGQVTFPVAAKGTYVIVALHEVTFHSDNAVTTRAVRHGVAVTEPAAPTKTGYTFGGWYTNEACTTAYNFSIPVTGEITLYAKWILNQYTVTFEANGGTCDTSSVVVDHGSAIGTLPTPTRGGYWYFDGWYTASTGGNEVTVDTVFNKDTTIYAQWYYDEPYYPPTPVTPPTTTEKTENEDGSTTTTVTNNETGTVTETTKNVDGSTTVVETKKDGTVTETVENTDGSTAVTETKTEVTVKEDGSTETTTTSTTTATDAAGNVTTSTTTATETTTVKEDGVTVTKKVEQTKSESAETTVETKTTATTTATEEKTETVAVTEEIVTKADGTTETTTTTTTETVLADGTTGTAVTDETGKTEATVTISEEAAASDEPVNLPIPPVTTTTDNEAASTITVTTNSEEDTKVAIPVVDVSSSTVAVIVNEDGSETVITETKMTENGLVIDVPDGATIKIVDNSTDFHDVEDHHWENDAIDFASARGLVNGVGDNRFDKDGITTRAHVVTLLARLAGVDTTPDEGETWYDKGHEWAVKNGLTYAGNMNAPVSRQSMFTMMWVMMGAPESDYDISHFTDTDGLTQYTEEAARWAVEIGLVGGHGNGTMDPTGTVTRGQLAQFLMNFIQKT